MDMDNKKRIKKALNESLCMDEISEKINIDKNYIAMTLHSADGLIFYVDIDYKTSDELDEIVDNIIQVISTFDFSYTLEFKKIEDFELYI